MESWLFVCLLLLTFCLVRYVTFRWRLGAGVAAWIAVPLVLIAFVSGAQDVAVPVVEDDGGVVVPTAALIPLVLHFFASIVMTFSSSNPSNGLLATIAKLLDAIALNVGKSKPDGRIQ